MDTKVKSDNVFSLAMSRGSKGGSNSKKTDGPTKVSLDIDFTVS